VNSALLVKWTPEAERDVATIVEWFADPINALKVIEHLEEQAHGLSRFPERGRVVPELRAIGILTFQEIIYWPWRIMYSIKGREVWIMAVLDVRRNLQDLLYERLAEN
jgi:plasmid stabilization system protein ParE